MEQLIDARGRSCPEPVMLAKQGLAQAKGTNLTILVDTPVARENVTRFLQASTKRPPTVQSRDDGSWAISIQA